MSEPSPEPSEQSEPRPEGGRFLRFLRITGWIMGIFLFGGMALTQTEWGEKKITVMAVQAIEEQLGLEASLGDVEVRFGWLPPEVFVHAADIDLDHPEYGDFVEADSLIIRPSLLAFMSGSVDLQTIEINDPAIHLIVEEGRVVNLPQLPETSGAPTALPFDRVVVRNASVSVDASPYLTGELRHLGLVINADGTEMEIELDCEEGDVHHAGGTETLQRLLFEGSVDLEDGVAEARRAAIRTPFFRVLVRDGVMSFDPEEGYAGEVVTRFDLAQIGRLPTALELPLEGIIELEANIRGRGDQPSGTGTLHLINVVVDKYGLGDEITLELEGDRSGLDILEGSIAHLRHGGTVALSGRLGLDPDEGFPVEIRAGIDDLNVGKFMDQLGVTENSIISWPLTGVGELRGTLDPFMIQGPLRLRTRNFLATIEPWHHRHGTRLIGVEHATIRGMWRFDEEAAKFIDLHVDTGRSQVDVGLVHLGFDNRLRVEATATNIDLRDISPLTTFELAGNGPVTMLLDGTFDDIVLHGGARMAGFEFETFPFGDVETDYELRSDYMAVLFPNVRGEKNASRFRVDDLMLDFKDERVEVTGHFRASRIALQDVYHAFHYETDDRYTPFQAVGRGHMSLRYTHGWPHDGPNGTFATNMEFDLLQATFNDITYDRGRFQGDFTWHDYARGLDGGDMTIEHFELRKGEGTVVLAGDIRPDRVGEGPANLHLTLSADQLALSSIEGLGDRQPDLQGIVSVLGEIRGTPDVPRMHLDVALTGVRWAGAYLGDGRAYVRLTDRSDPWVAEAATWDEVPEGESCAHARYGLAKGRWRAGPPLHTADGPVPRLDTPMAYLICGEGLGGQVKIDMAMGWTDVYPLRGVIDLARLQLDPLLRTAISDRDVGGRVSGRIAITGGSMLRDGSIDGWVHLDRLRLVARDTLQERRFRLRNHGPIDVRLQRGGFEMRQAELLGPSGTSVSISGGGDAQGMLGLQIDGVVDLQALESLSPEVARSSGRLALRVNVGGRVDDPNLHGDAEISGASLALRQLEFAEIEDLNGRIEFSERRAIFEGFRARAAGGRFELEGSASIREGALHDFSFDMRVRDALMRPDEGVRVGMDGEVRLAWSQGDRLPLLAGELRLERVRYERPIQLSPTLGQLYRPQRAEVERYDPAADNVALNLRILDASPIRIRNNLLDMDLRIDDSDQPFRIVGTDQRYGIVGRIEVARGKVRFRNTEMDVIRGEVRFADETRLDASFDVVAETEIRRRQSSQDLTAPTWRVQVRAHGNMDGFRLDASSQPQLSQEDLMLLLTVGMTSAETQQLQAGDVGGTALEALSALAGVNEEVTNAVQVIDEFAITTRYSPVSGRPEPMVTVGKRITDRVRLSAATGLTGEEREFQTGIEWQVGDQTSFQVLYDNINRESSSSFGNLGLDFHWRLEFE